MYRRVLPLLFGIALVAFGTTDVRSGAVDGVRALESLATPVRIQRAGVVADAVTAPQACDLGTANECFDTPGNTFLNVGVFFDADSTTNASHYFLKLYRNETAASVQLRGMGFESTSSHSGFNGFQAAGAIVMGQRTVFPKPEALLELPEVDIPGADGEMTCVEFSSGIDTGGVPIGQEIVLAPGDAAWLVLRFPTLPDSIFVGVRCDDDPNDQPCDYMTRDGGEHWFRPDPLHGPIFDWGITAFTEPRLQRQSTQRTWTLVKSLYR
ncbi:MAG: hypothetical protein JSW67_14800 [Candidatus Latescibacterota bacterium]|nr:MAG: hypothetical protein JSW67_14800 [Candidatus Latescibacterota bacterium]